MDSATSASAPAWHGGPWGERATCVLCPNPGPMTLDGTNTWVLGEPGAHDVVVLDPGPLHEPHLQEVLRRVAERGQRVALTVLSHGHPDHAESAARFAALTGAPVRALGDGPDGLCDGTDLGVGGLDLQVVTTPGHTGDSLCLLLPADGILLTGDTVLGRGTTVVAHPDGRLEDYLRSLERIRAMTEAGTVTGIGPGHGPVVPDAAGTVRYYLEHRRERLEQVREAVARLTGASGDGQGLGAAGDGTGDLADAVVRTVYADVPHAVWPAARLSVLAQLDYLREQGLIEPGGAGAPGR